MCVCEKPTSVSWGENNHVFWTLILAHFIGDFLLQTDWMARNRDKFWVLTLHTSIHFGVMLLLIGNSRSEYWPLITLLSLIHMGQDALKIVLVQRRPDLSVLAFFLDQILHYSFIWVFIWVFQMGAGFMTLAQRPAWVMIAMAYLLVTFVWFITEKVLYQSKSDYVVNINETKYSRMVARAGMVSLFLFIRVWVIPGLAMVLPNPYSSSEHRKRFLLTDVSVSIFIILFLLWALG